MKHLSHCLQEENEKLRDKTKGGDPAPEEDCDDCHRKLAECQQEKDDIELKLVRERRGVCLASNLSKFEGEERSEETSRKSMFSSSPLF